MIDKKSEIPIFRQIYSMLKMEMQSGQRKKGDLLPGTRSFARELNVSRNSVDRAYVQLEIEGYILSKPSIGFEVLDNFNDINFEETFIHSKPIHEDNNFLIDFKYGGNAFTNFPKAKWQQYSMEVLSSQTDTFLDHKGSINLRVAIAKYLHRHRGVHASYEQIVITNGYVYSLEIIMNMLKMNHTNLAFAMEDPGFPVTRNTLLKNGVGVESIRYQDGKLNLPENLKNTIQAIIVTPSHHFPLGNVMQVSMRQNLLSWARKHDVYVIEDDYDSEFRYKGDPIPSLQSLDSDGNVIYFGTFSKPLSSTLRMSYLVIPPSLLPQYEKRYEGYTSTVSTLQQSVLERFINNHDYERHIRKMRNTYRKKHDLIRRLCEEKFGSHAVHGEYGGLFILLEVSKNVSSEILVDEALQNGVKVYPTTDFYSDGRKTSTVFMGFTDLSLTEIENGIELLYQAWFNGEKN
ncbi:PLP-dependent aminotransferase family protein [Erysipelothrix anatis]|uniref:MocR-like pyridoxine biosynthesis transcription factor PdxR n=1 Tax=Erysipelothrix anatis TaxID=2683713 RepID=UPI001356E152|nr:PLP-dependent aminotransferase family protein [Erysipelothrix anatis]